MYEFPALSTAVYRMVPPATTMTGGTNGGTDLSNIRFECDHGYSEEVTDWSANTAAATGSEGLLMS